jgi:serine/threonine protein kinase
MRKIQYIAFKLAEHGDLFDLISEKGPLTEQMARFCFRQILDGVNFFHQKGIAHRDLKLENLLIDDQFDVKIADFGFAAFTTRTLPDGKATNILTDNIGTRGYKAPEIDNGDKTFGS